MTIASADDVRRFVSLLARPGDVFELRGLARFQGQQHVTTGYFDDLDQLVRTAVERSGKDDGVYLTVNPVNPALLARAPKNKIRRAGSGDTTSDKDVAARRMLLVDVDPVRPTGISSTDVEHEAAIALTRRIRDELAAAGWPTPILADSGNGGHLLYAVDLPVDDGGVVRRVLEQLSKRYSTPTLKVDEKVFNPARISKVYGTLTRKGENTADRPHRIARILEAPEQLGEVARTTLEAFAPAQAPRAARGTQAPSTHHVERQAFDVDAFVAQHLPDAKERPWASGRKWIVPVCPFSEAHDRGEAHVEQLHSGAMSAGCLHESCKWGWRELRQKFDPEAYAWEERRQNGTAPNGRKLTDREPPPEVMYEDSRYADVIARTEAEYDRIAADEERVTAKPAVGPPPPPPPRVPWHRCPDLVAAIMERAGDPWVDLTLVGEELARARAGATVVLIGGSGSGKSSLTSCLLIEHARNVGPAIALSIELPAEELGARIVGIRCDASWEDALRGRVKREFMTDALDIPRLYVLDRRRATLANLEKAIDAARAEYPDQPILVAIDYAQLIDSREREARLKVADAFAQIDDLAREKRVVALALSQMSRASAVRARKGEAIGADSADLGAETAAIERFATLTLSIGLAVEREDGSSAVELSVGKARMGKGDRVIPMTYHGRTGLWRVAGEAKSAIEVRDQRNVQKNEKLDRMFEAALRDHAARAPEPLSRGELKKQIPGKADRKTAAIARLIKSGDLVEVARRAKGSKKSDWMVWTPDRARDAGIQIVTSELPLLGGRE